MTTTNNKTVAYIVRLPEGRIYEMVRILRTMDRWMTDLKDHEREAINGVADAMDNAHSLSERCESEAKEWEDAQGKYTGKDEWAEKCRHYARALREFAKLY